MVQEKIKEMLKGSNKKQLSEKSGVDRAYMYNIISGKSTPSIGIVEKLLGAMGKELVIRRKK